MEEKLKLEIKRLKREVEILEDIVKDSVSKSGVLFIGIMCFFFGGLVQTCIISF